MTTDNNRYRPFHTRRVVYKLLSSALIASVTLQQLRSPHSATELPQDKTPSSANDDTNNDSSPSKSSVVAETKRRIPSTTVMENEDATTNWHNVDCPLTEIWNDCDLSDPRWGTPTILISLGRSGSSVTWDTLAALTVGRKKGFQMFAEDLGSSREESLRILSKSPDDNGKCVLERILCARQHENKLRLTRTNSTKPGIFGTKLKPFIESFGHAKSRQALQWLGVHPYIKVIHNERNVLDMCISKYKHRTTRVPSHCRPGRPKCLARHRMAENSLVVQTDTILEEMEYWENTTIHTIALLNQYHVSFVQMKYEQLYYSDDMATEWNKVFNFVTGSTSWNLTQADVLPYIGHVATSPFSLKDKMANYEQVQAVLKGTHFERYLHS